MTFSHTQLVTEMDRLRKFARRLTHNRDDAEDLLQNTVLRALEKRHMFETGSDLFAWTSKMMFNIFATQYKRRVKFESRYDCEEILNTQSSQATQEHLLEFRQVGEAIGALSDDHKSVLMMVCVQGLPYDSVASELHIPVGTVRSRLSRARDQLRTLLGEAAVNAPLDGHTPPAYQIAALQGRLSKAA